MDIGLHASECVAKVRLRIAVVPIVRLGREPAIDVVAIANQESACVGGTIEDSITGAVMSKKSRALDADLRSLLLLRDRRTS